MKVYFNSIGQFLEQDTTMDLFVKGNNGNVVECYFNGLDISDKNLSFRMVVKWSDGTTTNELPMVKSLTNDYVYLTLPILKIDGEAQFIIRIYRNTYIEHTAIFKRGILAGIDASDDTVSTEEYEVLLQNIDDIRNRKQDNLISGKNIKTINGMSITGEGNLEVVTTGDRIWIRYAEDVLGTNMSTVPLPTHEYMGTYTGVLASANPSDYVWAKYSSELTTVTNGSITTEKLADNCVTPEKTSFIDVNKSANLLNPNVVTNGILIYSDGSIINVDGYSATDFIKVESGDVIYITYDSSATVDYQNALFDKNKNAISSAELGGRYMRPDNETTEQADGYRKFTIPNNSNVAYYRACFEQWKIPSIMIVKNYYPTEYIAYTVPEIKFNNEVELGNKQLEQVNQLPIKSVLKGKSIACCGDSIMESRLGEASYNGGGWSKIIADKNNMSVNNVAKSGSTICNYYDNNVLVENMTIYKQLETLNNEYDYIILDGGVNDFSVNKTLGNMLNLYQYSNNASSYNKETILGALEYICMKLNTTHHNSKYGWVFNHKIYVDNEVNGNMLSWLDFKNKMKEVFKKWGIPFIDLEELVPPLNYISNLKAEYTCNSDGWHPNEEGYRKFYCDKIEAWLESL